MNDNEKMELCTFLNFVFMTESQSSSLLSSIPKYLIESEIDKAWPLKIKLSPISLYWKPSFIILPPSPFVPPPIVGKLVSLPKKLPILLYLKSF